ncbi:hypothetical protein CBR_g49169 [Chara braunii]|uniref:Uncharacterized protein n=1 Tax=Chara braunii TaxID=69332 RepID=A0A388M460_CHABU|nr:hypothetical protein CBR_g49169 [Chara braunii]|eukprot:GBG89378.1 hypothetical protein CBR_g49169 [Chara braunii]
MPKSTTPTQPDLRDDGACRPAVCPAPTVENITRGVSNMRAHSDGDDDDGGGGDDADERFGEDLEAGDDDGDIPIRPLGKTGGRGRGRSRGVVRGRSVGRGGRGDASDDGGKSATYWSPEEQMQQLPRRGAGAGESVGSEAAGEGFPEERSYTRDSDNNATSGAGGAKQKNARQQALESIADVMDRLGELMSSTIESSSKRQCSIFTRQWDILEQEVAVQKAHYAASNETQRMMCHALMEIAAAIRGNTRGKKRGVVPDNNQGQGRRRWHAPKAKRARLEDVSARVPHRGAQGWAAAAGGDYDEEFTAEEKQAEATMSAVRESGRQRSFDQSASKRMLTPPPEAQQLRARETQTEKDAVVDLGGEDDEPFDRCRMRTRTTATPPPAVTARATVNERSFSGRLPATPSQPRQRNEGGDGGSVQRGGGGEVVADARAVGAEAAGAAGAGDLGIVAPVATARDEAAVVATAREEARGEKKGNREGSEPGSSRVRRGVMTKDLIDRAVLWVDDEAFWTTGEGRRLYNIVHDTREYFVAIANGLPPPAVPVSIVLLKSSTRVGRIVDQSQLHQAIFRAAAVKNVALRILHGWVFKSGNRPRDTMWLSSTHWNPLLRTLRVLCGTARSGATSSVRRFARTR